MLSGKKADTKDYVLYDSIYMKFLEKAKLRRESRSEIGWGWRLGAGIDH